MTKVKKAAATTYQERSLDTLPSGMYDPKQTKQVQCALEVREAGEEAGAIRAEFIISNYGIDSYGTRFDPDGIDLTQYRKNPIITYRHMRDGGMFSLPIGRGLVDTIRKDAQGNIRMTVEFTPEEVFPFGHQVGKLVKNRFMNMGSIGADPIREEVITEADGRKTLVFREWMLYEFAIVPIGSNDDALCTKRLQDLSLDREELLVREREVEKFIRSEDLEDAHLLKVVQALREEAEEEEETEEETPVEDDKVRAECHTTDKGTYVSLKIRREKDGKEHEFVHRDVIFVPADSDAPVAPSETKEQRKHREYFTQNKDSMKAYREFMDRTYKLCGIKQPVNELDAVRGLDTLFSLASTAPAQERVKTPRKTPAKVDRAQMRASVTKLVKDVVLNSREALLKGEPVRNLDDILEREIDAAIRSVSISN